MTKKRKLFYVLIVFYFVISLVYFSFSFYVNRKLDNRNDQLSLSQCSKVWATRGLNIKSTDKFQNANNIEAVTRAFKAGAKGTEIDVYFDVEQQDYIVSHDYPYNLKDGKILLLSELFKEIGKGGYFWLDFKKMRHLSKQNVIAAVNKLRQIVNQYSHNDLIYVEGHDPINLSYFRADGFNTIFDIHPPRDYYPFTSFVINIYKMFYYFGNHTVMGIEHDDIDNPVFGNDTKNASMNVPLFIYHVPNDKTILNQLSKQKNIKVILNIDDSVNSFDVDSCE